ncbi:lipid-A-disaccharide synthase N-terminal domain-containing protein [Dyella acidiphila]|uniref:Lipid-A-disaccharide synthase N-terminal domain-containing protein n=1 Tax=Dyella acidiphila TaxID=2775866 RepID=A0ABR9G4V4_9GAMM|nr:lipid-A-disaccharide synthase N-terminal domain-containing protein [Dyella acidiphila]MBE1159082.1 lipid-A-disaccharide synthase N-terminal domain-containing protein [Dyella acidiphila]
MSVDSVWIGTGLFGQALFGARFLVQWLYSEARGKSEIPSVFWYLSVAGGVILLSYAIHRREPVFIIGESITLLIFLRNLQMLHKRPDPG